MGVAIDQLDHAILDVDRVRAFLDGLAERALLLLMYTTGARVHEIVNLDFGDIHLDTVPRVTIRGKGNKQRTCPLQPRTVKALEGCHRGKRGEHPYST